jgi:hypothetical protein
MEAWCVLQDGQIPAVGWHATLVGMGMLHGGMQCLGPGVAVDHHVMGPGAPGVSQFPSGQGQWHEAVLNWAVCGQGRDSVRQGILSFSDDEVA